MGSDGSLKYRGLNGRISCAPAPARASGDIDWTKAEAAVARAAAQRHDEGLFDVEIITIRVGELRASMPPDRVPADLLPLLAAVDRQWRAAFGARYDDPLAGRPR